MALVPQDGQTPEDRLVEEAVEHLAIAVARRVVARKAGWEALHSQMAGLPHQQRDAIEACATVWAMDVAAESAAVGVYVAKHGGPDVPEDVIRRAYTWGVWIGGGVPDDWHLVPAARAAEPSAN